jgi:hypothetical protein
MPDTNFPLGEGMGDDNVDVQSPAQILTEVTESEQINYLEGRETNFIFLFGRSGIGKTAITASIINYLSTGCEYGNLVGIDSGDGNGRLLLEQIRSTIRERRFPERTVLGSLTEIEVRFEPLKKSKPHVWITFLDMSGEDLDNVEVKENSPRQLPSKIDVFFKANNLSMIFVLVTSHEDAHRDDSLMVTFLDYIIGKDSRFRNSRVLLLISKWDSFVGEIDTEEFIMSRMPLTYARLRNNTHSIRTFSIGRVISADGKPHIQEYNPVPAENVFLWIYKSLTGKSLGSSWWERLRRYM